MTNDLQCRSCKTAITATSATGLCRKCIMTDLDCREKRKKGLLARLQEDPEICSPHILHIPPELRAEYKRLTKNKKLRAKDVTAVLQKEHPAAFELHAKAQKVKQDIAKREDETARWIVYRLRHLPTQLAAARRKVQALETEAARLNLYHLLEN